MLSQSTHTLTDQMPCRFLPTVTITASVFDILIANKLMTETQAAAILTDISANAPNTPDFDDLKMVTDITARMMRDPSRTAIRHRIKRILSETR